MQLTKLDIESLTVDSFQTGEPDFALVAQQKQVGGDIFCCSGCVSGCGINPTASGCASGGGDATLAY
jgi:hypothetical protein